MDHLRISLLSMHSCPWSKPGGRYTGGMNVYIQNLSREMGKLGIATDIYTCSHEGDELCSFSGPAGNVRLIHVDAGSCGSASEAGQADYAGGLAQSVHSYCRERELRYDVIQSHYWLSGLAGNYLKDLWQVPHVSMFHTLGDLKNISLPGSMEPVSRISHERSVIHSCDRIIASTPVEKLEMVNRYGAPADKIRVIPCGVDLSLFRPIHRQAARAICGLPEKKTLLFVGRPDPIKGLENLLRAASMLRRDRDFQLLVIGCGNRYMGDRWQTAGRHGGDDITDRVIFTGPVEHEKMYLYYNAADLCVIPSYYESFCLTALESVACGTPVLATRVGEIPEISRLSSLCKTIADNSPESLALHISILLQGNGMDTDRSGSALSIRYGWDSIARKIAGEYEDFSRVPVNAVKAATQIVY
jgi:D-inositol-3-phosphate glycosyltransferase